MLNNNFLLHLTLIEDIGPAIIAKIMERSDVQKSDLYLFSVVDWMRTFGLSEKTASKIVMGLADMAILEKELQLIETNNIQLVTILDESYPALLKEIHLPPVVLYYQGAGFEENPSIHAFGALRASGEGEIILNKGNMTEENLDTALSLSNIESSSSARPECAKGVYRRVSENKKPIKRLAIVGARKANAYGQKIIHQIVPDLVAAGYTIVSGGALGIDTMAHQATLACGGKTIAVLGSGLLRPYPRQNKSLFKNIVDQNGTMVSSYPLSTEPLPGNFPARNRIVTGLSRGCLVVQAAEKSGALISAHYALEQGRDVFAVPGLYDDELSAGCHEIIKQGAKLVVSATDILNEFGDRVIMPAIYPQSHSSIGVLNSPHFDSLHAATHWKELQMDQKDGVQQVGQQQNLFSTQADATSILFEDKKLPTMHEASSNTQDNFCVDPHEAITKWGQASGEGRSSRKSEIGENQLRDIPFSARPECAEGVYRRISEKMYSETQKNILRACAKPISCDDIILTTQLNSEIVQAELFNLQLDGVLEQDFMGMWAINNSTILTQE